MTSKKDDAQRLPDTRPVAIDIRTGHLGVTLSNTATKRGALISDVHPADLFASAGLKVGDVIVSIGGTTVDGHDSAFAEIDKAVETLRLEYWTEAEAAVAAKIQGPPAKAALLDRWWVWALVTFLILAVSAYPFYNDYQTKMAEAMKSAAPKTTIVMGDPDEPKSTRVDDWSREDVYKDMAQGTLDEYEERLEGFSRLELVRLISRVHPDYKPKESQSVESLRGALVSHAEGFRKHSEEVQRTDTPEKRAAEKRKKAARQLKLKDAAELRDMMQAVHVAYPEEASAKELRERALEQARAHAEAGRPRGCAPSDALTKWEALPEARRLEFNRARAADKAKASMAKQRAEAHERLMNEDEEAIERRAMKPKLQPWEIEWDANDEKEALERMSKLEAWKDMTPEEVESMMQKAREDKGFLNQVENEERIRRNFKDMPKEVELSYGDLKRMGMSTIMFDKTNDLDDMKVDMGTIGSLTGEK